MIPIIGLDLGFAADYSAISVLDRELRTVGERDPVRGVESEDHYTAIHLERPPLKTPYPDVIATVKRTVDHPRLNLHGRPDLVVDATGVGRPVIDMLRAAGLEPIPVTITAGQQVTIGDDGFWRVPKRILVSAMAIALQTGRLHVRSKLALAKVLTTEMLAFKVKINTHANESYEAWREGDHDDLVLSVALAVWWGERHTAGGWTSPDDGAKERRRKAHIERGTTPWWRAQPVRDRGPGAAWKK